MTKDDKCNSTQVYCFRKSNQYINAREPFEIIGSMRTGKYHYFILQSESKRIIYIPSKYITHGKIIKIPINDPQKPQIPSPPKPQISSPKRPAHQRSIKRKGITRKKR